MPFSRRAFLAVSIVAMSGTQPVAAEVADSPDVNMMANLVSNAKTAWSYFRLHGNSPSIVPSAAWFEGQDIGQHQVVTMWDIGSTILAYIAAAKLGIIDSDELKKRGRDVLDYIAETQFTFEGNRLPNFRNSSVDGSIVEAGFDSTDMGRLFVALWALDRVTDGEMDVRKVVERWDVAGTIRNGALHDIKGSEIKPAESYVYAAYVSTGYRLWGISHSPFLPLPVDTPQQKRIFLDEVQRVGMIAAEPSLSEAVELGMSPQSQVLSDALFEAQRERFESKGLLTAVSEGPLDKAPWFSYQGYRPNGPGDKWPVDALEDAAKWRTAAFRNGARMVSSKAAFLWLATRPEDPYAKAVYNHVAGKAASEQLGFSSGIYEKSGKTVAVYDVNTNAVILEAIAFMKNGFRPLAGSV